MVLISEDLPAPFGPRIAACSPAAMDRLMPSSTLRPFRTSVIFLYSIRGGLANFFPDVKKMARRPNNGRFCTNSEHQVEPELSLVIRKILISFIGSNPHWLNSGHR